MAVVTIDSYSEGNYDGAVAVYSAQPYCTQSFAGDGYGDTIEFITAGNKPVIGGKYPLPPNDVEGI